MSDFTRDDARLAYLNALSSEAPEVLKELDEIARMPGTSRYEGVPGWDAPSWHFGDGLPWGAVAEAIAGGSPDLSYLEPRDLAFFNWLVRWRLCEPWAIQWADQTAHRWESWESWGNRRDEWAPELAEMKPIAHGLKIELYHWYPERETWETWSARAMEKVRYSMAQYRKIRRSEVGDGPALRRLPDHHYVWLVRHYNFDWPFMRIAQEHTPPANEKTVRLAVPKAAEIVGLTLRPPTRGRPRIKSESAA